MDYLTNVQIDPTSCVARNATIVGDVAIGPSCTILFNATVRGDCGGTVTIGSGTNIQENACIHVQRDGDTHIGSNVTIGHGAIVHCASVGDNTVVGMGAILLDRAIIGANCMVGAGAVVTGKMKAEDGSLILGNPARVVRSLTPEEIADLSVAAEEYVQIGQDMAAQGILAKGNAI